MPERLHLALDQVVSINGRSYVVKQDPNAPPRLLCGQIDRFIIEPTETGAPPTVTLDVGQRVLIGVGVYDVTLETGVAQLRYLYSASTD
ncbi:MAG: hypothetical protein HY710_01910 [Candidatus Latescibacteria bacterium]|nr:hypothetical protein [Candidatus Latescibacterota bacterium]